MRKLVTVTVTAVLVLGTLGITMGAAGASVPGTSKFCKAVKSFNADDLGNPASRDDAEQTIASLEKIQKAAKGKTKKAVGVVIESYQDYAGGDSAREAFGNGAFIKASGTMFVAISKCFLNELPDITIPSRG